MTTLQIKVPFAWVEPKPHTAVPSRLVYSTLDEVGDEQFLEAIRLCLAEPMDRHDIDFLRDRGDFELARKSFVAPLSTFEYRRSWWHLAHTDGGDLIGFLQPVIFRDCRRGDLEEGAIYNYGVVPKHRGRGHGQDLIRKLTAVLQDVGVWRIFADVDEANIPSLKTLSAVG